MVNDSCLNSICSCSYFSYVDYYVICSLLSHFNIILFCIPLQNNYSPSSGLTTYLKEIKPQVKPDQPFKKKNSYSNLHHSYSFVLLLTTPFYFDATFNILPVAVWLIWPRGSRSRIPWMCARPLQSLFPLGNGTRSCARGPGEQISASRESTMKQIFEVRVGQEQVRQALNICLYL